MSMVLWIGLLGAGGIGFVTAWRWMRLRLDPLMQSLELRLKLRERDLRLAEERLRRLESERWRPTSVAAVQTVPSTDAVEVDADGLPKRAVPAAVQAELLGLQHACATQRLDLELMQRDLAARTAEVVTLRAALDAASRRAEAAGSAESVEQRAASD
jgi:hypothetical protein